ncbi:PepSY domain-containing protein [Pelagicoccus sp. SDUM812003]|uniref:PepSY-associated TM helix domain-containing protein n=1 Tax=Pelagicoccus sp. SDUM812003 TaxID=3041267 RepID=UPI00280F3684|nr:PepSY domain-containing protein [Pelagicoccus sp. SDUM812003]MDQ8202589.1 PepSY domain-containing protein [Pelagicoccus sp. SDUM812003]
MYSDTASASELAKPKRRPGKIYQLVWRWHFWAGLLVSPVLIIVAITGALYVFKDEIERLLHSETLFVEPGGSAVPHSTLESAIAAELPEAELHYLSVSKEPDRAWIAYVETHKADGAEETSYVYFDPYKGEILGHHPSDEGFFRVILDIHRRLMSGTIGRLVVETATCWGIVSVLSGLYLWWPRKKEKIKGVWIPRSRGSKRTLLRDWHTIPGVYLSFFLLAIMGTGLFFTNIWGTGLRIGTALSGGFPEFYISPPKSAHVEDHSLQTRISADEVWKTANDAYSYEGRGYGMEFPHHDTDDAFSITTDISVPFAKLGATFIDQYTGELLLVATSEDLPFMSKVLLLFYPIHVGSIFGLGTKILAVLSCLILIAMCVTGIWMWWRRRPSGATGAPRKTPPKTAPKWMAWLTIALAVLLPTVGASLLFIGLVSWISGKIRPNRAA